VRQTVSESEGQFRAALDLEPANVRWLVGMGDWYRAGGKRAAALGWYGQALRVSPNHAAALERVRALE
jgi:cytochrome c-type biogenesis protein CcmH/NrfG